MDKSIAEMAEEIRQSGYTYQMSKNDIILITKGTSKKFKSLKAAHKYAIENKRE